MKKNERINFNTVSIESGVSKSYLYNHPEFHERIEMLRKQSGKSPKAIKRQMSDESNAAKI
nr:DUF6262 family protein [Bacillus cereus]